MFFIQLELTLLCFDCAGDDLRRFGLGHGRIYTPRHQPPAREPFEYQRNRSVIVVLIISGKGLVRKKTVDDKNKIDQLLERLTARKPRTASIT